MSEIFGRYAPHYYKHGLNVIPLHPKQKRPILDTWSQYAIKNVPPNLQTEWASRFANANMGLVLGEASGVIVIDIDTTDEKLIQAIRSLLPFSPWERKGAKGLMLAYKWKNSQNNHTFRIKNTSGEMIVEMLSSRTQCVLPPSIHPDTLKPYTSNTDLWAVLPKLTVLPEDIEEKLRTKLTSLGVSLSHSGWTKVSEYVSAGSRDTALTSLAGLFAFSVMRGEVSLKDAIGMLIAKATAMVEQVAGDPVDPDKHVKNMIKFLQRDVFEKGALLPEGWNEGLTPEELTALGIDVTKDNEVWDYEYTRDYLKDKFELNPANSPGRREVVDRVLKQMAKADNFSKIDEDRILSYIVEVSEMGVRIASLRSQLKEYRGGDVKGNDHTEIAVAVLSDLQLSAPVRRHAGSLWQWKGSHWEKLEPEYIQSLIAKRYGKMNACKRASDISGILKVLTIISEDGINEEKLNGVNFANGFLTEDLKLLEHSPEFGMTYTLPYRYVPENSGKFPMFNAFLSRCWSQDSDYKEKMLALQEALAATIFGIATRYQRAILCYGAASTGKTQLLDIVQSLVADEARCAVNPDAFADKFISTQLFNKVLNIAGELSETKLIPGSSFKEVIDGSIKSGQLKGQQVFEYKPVCAHWFASNHFPRSSDSSSGFTRRWLIFSFNHPIKDSEKITDLGMKIVSEEREAIVAWAVQAVLRLKVANHFTIPDSHKSVLYDIGNLTNTVRFFMRESHKVTSEKGASVPEQQLFNAYWAFAMGNGGFKPVSPSVFRARMRELAVEMGFDTKATQLASGGQEIMYLGLKM